MTNTNHTAFETNLSAMISSIKAAYRGKARAMLMPNASAERATHERSALAGESCPCRVCYWAK